MAWHDDDDDDATRWYLLVMKMMAIVTMRCLDNVLLLQPNLMPTIAIPGEVFNNCTDHHVCSENK